VKENHERQAELPGFAERDRGRGSGGVRSDRSDLKKFEKLKLHQLDTGEKPDIFDGLFTDHTIDIRTGELLGRYIAEERDTARLFRSCYEQLATAGNGSAAPPSESLQSRDGRIRP
jgi:hypothetical protein